MRKPRNIAIQKIPMDSSGCNLHALIKTETDIDREKQKSPRCGLLKFGVPYEIRTRVIAVKGRCPRPLDEGDFVYCNHIFDGG